MKKNQKLDRYLLLAVLVFIGVGALFTHVFFQYRDKLLAQAEFNGMNLARVLEERLGHTLQRLDAELIQLTEHLGQADLRHSPDQARREQLQKELKSSKLNFPEVSDFAVFGQQGQLLYGFDPTIKPFSVAERSYFVQLRDNPSLEFAFSNVVNALSSGLPTLVMARPIRSRDGQFLGVVVGLLNLQHFQGLFASLNIGSQGIVSIRSHEGSQLVLRHPEKPDEINKGVNSPIRERIVAGDMAGHEHFASPVDAVKRVWSFRVLKDFPFNVSVGLAEDEVLADWYERGRISGLAFLVMAVLMAIALYRVWLSNQRNAEILLEVTAGQLALRENERQLREANRLHLAIETSITESIWLLNERGDVVTANQTATERLGIGLAQLKQQNVFQFFPETIRESRRAAVNKTVATKQMQTLLDNRNDRCYLNAFYPVLNAQGQCDHVVVVATDVTLQKSQEVELAESKRRLLSILDGTQTGTWEWEVQTGQVVFNERWAEIIGYQLNELGPTTIDTWLKFVHPDDLQQSNTLLQQHFGGELPYYECEVRMQHRDGHWIWVLDRGKVASWSDDRKPLLMSGTHQDISARKQLEVALFEHQQNLEKTIERRTADLEVAKEAAEAANRAKTAFLSIASHELRTPMNGVMGTIALAMRKTTDAVVLDYLGKAERASKQLLGIINDVLEISRIESNRLTLASTDFTFAEIRANVLDVIEGIAQAKHLELLYLPNDGLDSKHFMGDPTRISQILINIAGNALKFTHEGLVRITAQELVGANSPNDGEPVRIRFDIEDTGVGVSPEAFDRIFEPFEQEDASKSRRFGGTGLGLALCKRLVEAMSGRIGVRSEVGKGSTFWFEIDVLGSRYVPGAMAEDKEAICEALMVRHKGASILLVEDEPLNQEITRINLEEVGLDVFTASDGIEAVESAKSGCFDLILMDLSMPRMGGIEATYAIRTIPEYVKIPIIALTANAFAEDRDACIQAGMSDHIGKPVLPEVLYKTILRWLDNSPHQRRNE